MNEQFQKTEPALTIKYTVLVPLLLAIGAMVCFVAFHLERPQLEISNDPVPIIIAREKARRQPSYQNYVDLGLLYYKAQRYDESIATWQTALKYDSTGEMALNNIAAAYGNLKNYDAEIKVCERALAINPNFDLARRNLQWAQKMKRGQ